MFSAKINGLRRNVPALGFLTCAPPATFVYDGRVDERFYGNVPIPPSNSTAADGRDVLITLKVLNIRRRRRPPRIRFFVLYKLGFSYTRGRVAA